MRGCIGRPFAWQEVQLVMTTIFQKFDLSLVDPSYNLELKQALTIKPKDFYIRAIPRAGGTRLYATPSSSLMQARDTSGSTPSVPSAGKVDAKNPLYVLYGSNTGTSEAFAQRIATEAPSYGQIILKTSRRTAIDGTNRFPSKNRYIGLGCGACADRWTCDYRDCVFRRFVWVDKLRGQSDLIL